MLFRKDKHLILLVVSLLFTASICGQAGKFYKYHFDGDLRKGDVIASDHYILINYSISELNIESLQNNFGDFYRISIPGHNPSSDPGKPELPVLSRLISIPENSEADIRISDIKSQKISPSKNNCKGILYPRQIGETKDVQQQKPGFIIDKSQYETHGYISSDTIAIEFLGKVRNRKLGTLMIFPAKYNPEINELEIITSMKVEIIFSPLKGYVTIPLKSESLLFNQSLDKGVLNYNPDEFITGYSDQPVKMIILTDTAFRKDLKPFIKWKTQKGFKIMTLYKGSAFAGNTFAELKDTLTKIYRSGTPNDPAPEYLLIIGDANKIPITPGISSVSDMYYGEFDGSGDYIPDMFIGRLPVADTGELKTVINKIIQYEKFQFADSNKFYKRALVTAGNESNYVSYMNGQVKYLIDNYLDNSHNIKGYHFYYPQSYSAEDSIKKLINKGVSFVNYSGHGDAGGWLDPAIKVPEVLLFENKNMYPFVISNACRTANFTASLPFGNKWIVSKDKGGIGYIGCSNDSYWDEDFFWAVGVGTPNADPKYEETGLGAFDRLFHTHGESPSDWYITMGQVNYAGNLAVSSSTTSRKKYYWETYHLLGDPSVIPIISPPDSFKIAIPDTLPDEISSLSMIIDPFTYIAVSHFDTLWDASYSSLSGAVTLNFTGLPDDSCLFVMTGQNKVPLIKTVRFAQVKKEFINLSSSGLNDAAGNDNGLADYGESLFLDLTISNLGSEDANQLYAKISSTSEWITINNDSVYIGPLAGRSQITLSNSFGITIADSIPDQGFVTIDLLCKDSYTEKKYTIEIFTHAPELEVLNCLINDSLTGNTNYIAEPGETLKLVFKVFNSGSSDISGIFSIINQPQGVTIYQPSINTGLLRSGEAAELPITITLSPTLLNGSTFDITSLLNCTPYVNSKTFSVPVGKSRESFEYQSFNVFPWKNSITYPWMITDRQKFEGQFSARSGLIPNNSESLLKLSVNIPVPDSVSFQVKVSSEAAYDLLLFRLNGSDIFNISGEKGWISKKIAVKEGFNLLEWIYRKDESVSSGADAAWLDYITFPALAFKKTDLKTGKVITPEPNKNYDQEPVTVQIINLGTDTITHFGLAYKVNNDPQVNEYFNKTIKPGDTLAATFSKVADLSSNGTYIIKVFGNNNDDSYLFNDTASLVIVNTGIFTLSENQENKIRISPNPFTGYFRIIIDSKISENVSITVFDPPGKKLWEEIRDIVPGENSLTIIPDNLLPGFYTLRITGKTTHNTARIVKVE